LGRFSSSKEQTGDVCVKGGLKGEVVVSLMQKKKPGIAKKNRGCEEKTPAQERQGGKGGGCATRKVEQTQLRKKEASDATESQEGPGRIQKPGCVVSKRTKKPLCKKKTSI